MRQFINEELNRIKYLFNHERGRVISEQNLLIEQSTPKDQAEADAFRVYLNKPVAQGGAGVTFNCAPYGTRANLVASPGRKFTGPCMKAAWAKYGAKFKESQTQQTAQPSADQTQQTAQPSADQTQQTADQTQQTADQTQQTAQPSADQTQQTAQTGKYSFYCQPFSKAGWSEESVSVYKNLIGKEFTIKGEKIKTKSIKVLTQGDSCLNIFPAGKVLSKTNKKEKPAQQPAQQEYDIIKVIVYPAEGGELQVIRLTNNEISSQKVYPNKGAESRIYDLAKGT